MNNETIHSHPQQFFSVSKFLDLVDHQYSDDLHDQKACLLDIDSGYCQIKLSYRLLRRDVLVFDQDICIIEAEHSTIAPNPEGRFYLLKYVYDVNKPIDAVFNGKHCLMANGYVGICNNFGSHETFHPAGFRGRYLQIIIEHAFLQEFVDMAILRGTGLETLLYGYNGDLLSLPLAPSPVRRKLDKIVRLLHQPLNSPFDKLHILRAVGEVLEAFFTLYLVEQTQIVHHRGGDLPVADSIAAYLSACSHQPFPGLAYLANRFSLSESTLKRTFSGKYGITINQYFQNLKMQEAKDLLSGTDMTVSEIGYRLGFDNPGNFTRAFKQVFRMAPMAFRSTSLHAES